jgi:hypothetical protein
MPVDRVQGVNGPRLGRKHELHRRSNLSLTSMLVVGKTRGKKRTMAKMQSLGSNDQICGI